MISPATNLKLGAERIQESVASYFGILVKVIV